MFTVVGEALLDMVQPEPGSTYRALPAGGPLNIAVTLRRLGHPTALMARFSSGPLGARIRQYGTDRDLDLGASVVTDEQATLAFATIDSDGRASYDFYVDSTADWGWTESELSRLPGETRVVHTGSLAATIDPGAERILAWWRRLAAVGEVLLSFDPNVRPALAGDRELARQRVEAFVALSHVVKASDEDLGWLYPDRSPEESIRAWASSGPILSVLTRGPAGGLAVTDKGASVAATAPSVQVADTIGAGDAFQGGLLSGLATYDALSPAAVRSLSLDDLGAILQRAVTVAALTCMRPGADPPTASEYAEFAGERVSRATVGADGSGGGVRR